MKKFKNFKRKFKDFKIKPKYFIIVLVAFLSVGYAALNVSLVIEGVINLARDSELDSIYLSFASVNVNYVYTDNLSTEGLSLNERQLMFTFDSNLLNLEENVIAYRIMNRSTKYDITNTHVVCNDTDNYTLTDVDQGSTVEAQHFLDSNVHVEVNNEHQEQISCVLNYTIVDRQTPASEAELEETPQLTYDAYEVGYEYDGIDTIHSVGDALDYIYEKLN